MKRKLLIVAITISLFFRCGHPTSEQAGDEADEQHHDNTTELIELNNGAKWLVNDEMKPYVAEAEATVNSYISSHSSDYQALAAQLKEKNAALIKSCTMKGKSHEELHKWLHPHLELVDSLSKTETKENADKIIADIRASFQTYHQYFQ